jgi:hypothetical protein
MKRLLDNGITSKRIDIFTYSTESTIIEDRPDGATAISTGSWDSTFADSCKVIFNLT